MHDIDRTQIGFGCDGYEMETNPYSSGEVPHTAPPFAGESASTASTEMQLATDLMGVSTEEEFENFLGDLLSTVANAAGGFITGGTGQALGGLLKGAARQVLPVAQQHWHHRFRPMEPGQASEAGANESEAQLEAREWEAAQTFVRLAQEAAATAAVAPPGEDPATTAHRAMVEASEKVVPALLVPVEPPPTPGGGQQTGPHLHGTHHRGMHEHSGRWIRRGHEIILLGV
jgi:hypothetical protein